MFSFPFFQKPVRHKREILQPFQDSQLGSNRANT